MLVELTVRNFAVIEETRVELGPGLNVITGQTGAGKSLLVDALDFVLGGKLDREVFRAGTDAASVEAVFQAPRGDAWRDALAEQFTRLGQLDLGDDEVVVLARDAHREGRSVSRLNGRAVPASVARSVGELLVDIHGQGTHLSLLSQRFQLAVLDAYGGLAAQREAVARLVADVRRIQRELAATASSDREAAHRRDLLAFQANEIESANLRVGEEEELLRERELLANARAIQEAVAVAYGRLYDDAPSATDLAAQAAQLLQRAPDPDGVLAQHAAAIEAASAQLEDTARELRAYVDSIEADPARLDEVEERVELIRNLKRKYGDTEGEVLAFAQRARAQLDDAEHSEERRGRLEAELGGAAERAGARAWALSEARQHAALALADAVRGECGELGLGAARFEVALRRSPSAHGLPSPNGERFAYGEHGIDDVEFMISPNPGEELKPLAKIASGGETSRLMLAIKAALDAREGVPVLVFDEVDSGVGGRSGDVVGKKLWSLSRRSQVLCVTHLPQIAAYADRHFRVDKVVEGSRTFARTEAVAGDARIAELAAMLGGRRTPQLDGAARQLLDAAASHKETLLRAG